MKKKGYEKNLGGKLGALWEMWRIDILVVSASQDAKITKITSSFI